MYHHAPSKDELGEGSNVESAGRRNSSHTVSPYLLLSLIMHDTDTTFSTEAA